MYYISGERHFPNRRHCRTSPASPSYLRHSRQMGPSPARWRWRDRPREPGGALGSADLPKRVSVSEIVPADASGDGSGDRWLLFGSVGTTRRSVGRPRGRTSAWWSTLRSSRHIERDIRPRGPPPARRQRETSARWSPVWQVRRGPRYGVARVWSPSRTSSCARPRGPARRGSDSSLVPTRVRWRRPGSRCVQPAPPLSTLPLKAALVGTASSSSWCWLIGV